MMIICSILLKVVYFDGRFKTEDGRWKMEDGRWKMEDALPFYYTENRREDAENH
jgi:hypothetical protein